MFPFYGLVDFILMFAVNVDSIVDFILMFAVNVDSIVFGY